MNKDFLNTPYAELLKMGLTPEHLALYSTQQKEVKETMDNYGHFREITEEMAAIYRKKNRDYGNSFDKSLDEDGLLVAKIRLGDKYNRFSQLIKSDYVPQVKDESIKDTLKDMANYAIMTLMWIESQETEGPETPRISDDIKHLLDSSASVVRDKLLDNYVNSHPGADTDGDIYIRSPHTTTGERALGQDIDGDRKLGEDKVYG